MNNINKSSLKGFTLVELLVVIAIIATLAAISIPIGMRVMNSARKVEAQTQIKEIQTASKAYYKDYGTTPVGYSNKDTAYWSNSGDNSIIFRALAGEKISHNSRQIKYLKMKATTDQRGGMQRYDNGQIWGLFDPWSRAYILCYDRDLSGDFTFGTWGGVLSGKTVSVATDDIIVFSDGPTKGLDGNDVYSWK